MKRNLAGTSAVEEVLEFNRDRKPSLVRLKFRRMATDAFAFFRGTDHLFATYWPYLHPPDVGPAILICGDLHLENFGAYRSNDGTFLYDINDFDEALVAPCALDLVRCTTSILLAAQLWKFTPVQALRTVLTYLGRYRSAVKRSVKTGHVGEVGLGSARGPIWDLLERPTRGNKAEFLTRLTDANGSGHRRFKRKPGRFRNIGHDRRESIEKAVNRYGKDRAGSGAFDVVDVVFRIAGIGSLGVPRYAVLVRVGEGPDQYRLLDLKGMQRPALLSCAEEAQPSDGGSDVRRVVEAQRRLQAKPAAGLDVLTVGDTEYRLRELIPEENRTSLDELRKDPRRLRRAVAIAGRLTGWAHVRGSRWGDEDRSGALWEWTKGPGLDAVIASAVRYAERMRRDRKAFRHAAAVREILGANHR